MYVQSSANFYGCPLNVRWAINGHPNTVVQWTYIKCPCAIASNRAYIIFIL